MTLIEIIKLTGKIPTKFEFDNGAKFILEFSTNHAGQHVAIIWSDDHIFDYATGETKSIAEENLIKKLASE